MTRRFANTIFAISILCGVVIALTNGYGQDPGARSSDHGSKLADEAGPGGLPENASDGVFKSPTEYAKLIEPHLGVPPVVDLEACVEIPIFVDGKKFTGDPGIHCCDNPSLQMGDCMSGSVVQRYEGRTADGKPIPHVVWISFGRHDGRGSLYNVQVGNSVQMISRGPGNGRDLEW